MKNETDKERLLTDGEFLVWCGEHRVIGCGGSRRMEGVDRAVSICEDCKAKAQLAKDEARLVNIPKDMVAWILKRLNGKDASEFMLTLATHTSKKERKMSTGISVKQARKELNAAIDCEMEQAHKAIKPYWEALDGAMRA